MLIQSNKTIFLKLFLIWVAIQPFRTAEAGAPSLVIATFQSPFPPLVWYEKKEGKMKTLGAEPDILRVLASRAGIRYKLVIMPFPRIKEQMKTGKIDGSLGGWKLPERERYGIYMDYPMAHDFFLLYVMKGKEFKFKSVEDLFNKRIGKIRGVNVYPKMDMVIANKKMSVIEANSRSSLIQMLRLGRLDAMITSSVATPYDLESEGYNNIVALPKPLTKPQGTYIWFSKAAEIDPVIIDRFNQAMSTIRSDGTLEQLLSNYKIQSFF